MKNFILRSGFLRRVFRYLLRGLCEKFLHCGKFCKSIKTRGIPVPALFTFRSISLYSFVFYGRGVCYGCQNSIFRSSLNGRESLFLLRVWRSFVIDSRFFTCGILRSRCAFSRSFMESISCFLCYIRLCERFSRGQSSALSSAVSWRRVR